MNIFVVSPTNTGCAKWRAEIPAKFLRRRGHTVTFFHEGKGTPCPDVIVFSRSYHHDLSRLYDWAKSRNVRVVYDTDDALDLVDPWNPAYASSQKTQASCNYMAANADVVTTTTPELAQHLRRLNPNVVVVPNSVDPEEWTVAPRAPNRKIRIGWQGGSTHFRDLILVTEALSALARKRDFTFVIYGLTDMPSVKNVYRKHLKTFGDRFRHSPEGLTIKTFLKKTERLPYEFHPFVNTSNYVSTLCGLALDIGIAPLLDTPFNRKKSSIKYYEYGMSGAVTVASNVLPYSAEVPRLADNTTSAWEAQLTDLLSADLQSLWRSQYDWIMSHRNIEQNVVMWEKAFEANASASHLHQAVGDARQVPQVPPSPEGSSALADGLLTC